MSLPPLPSPAGFPFEPLGAGRLYRVTGRVSLAAFPVEAPLPHAPDGSYVYVFIEGQRVGRWEWTDRPEVFEAVMKAFRTTTSPDYVPPVRTAPGGEPAMLRPATVDLLQRTMTEGRPDPPEPDLPIYEIETHGWQG